jgi:hypothetical protein
VTYARPWVQSQAPKKVLMFLIEFMGWNTRNPWNFFWGTQWKQELACLLIITLACRLWAIEGDKLLLWKAQNPEGNHMEMYMKFHQEPYSQQRQPWEMPLKSKALLITFKEGVHLVCMFFFFEN